MENSVVNNILSKNNKSICAFPWLGAAVRPDGTIIPCCKFIHNRDFGNVNDADPRQSNSWNLLKEKMLAGDVVSNCQACYKDERNGLVSLRQESLAHFKPADTQVKKLKQLEVSFNNVCNLACVMCSEEYSTKWQSEKIKHRNFNAKGVTEHEFDYLSWDLSEVESLKIIGGEPLLSQNKFIELLARFDLSKLNVMIATNNTVLPNAVLKKMFEQCRKVSYKVSLDGIGPVNDWIRWPSKFSDIENNINTLEEWWGDSPNIDLQFHTVIGIYNILHLKDIVDYSLSRPKWKMDWSWLSVPSWQAINVLPNKHSLVKELEVLGSQYKLTPNPFLISMYRLTDDPQSTWQIAVEETLRLSKERKIEPVEWKIVL